MNIYTLARRMMFILDKIYMRYTPHTCIACLCLFTGFVGCRSNKEQTVNLSDGSYSGKVSRSGEKNGQGIYRWKDGSTYEGEYAKGKRHGIGKFLWANGESYKGEYQNDERTGSGEYIWPDGSRYAGQFLDGKRHGKGIFTSTDGVVYDGEWFDDSQHGEGTLVYPDGRIVQGIWRQGSLLANPNKIPSNSLKPTLPLIPNQNLVALHPPSVHSRIKPSPSIKTTESPRASTDGSPISPPIPKLSPSNKPANLPTQPVEIFEKAETRPIADLPVVDVPRSELIASEDQSEEETSAKSYDWIGTVAEAEAAFITDLIDGFDTIRSRSNGELFSGCMRILDGRGQPQGEVNLLNGRLHGEEIFFDVKGEVAERNFWSNGRPIGQ